MGTQANGGLKSRESRLETDDGQKTLFEESALESRIDRLEEENYYLKKDVRELDEALRFQQDQITKLQAKLEKSLALALSLKDALDGLREKGGELEVPPHYGKW